MTPTILKSKVCFTPFRNRRFLTGFTLFLLTLLSSATLFSQTVGQNPIRDKDTRWTRITISTSGPAKFNSYWLTWPPRLVIEFQSRNVVGKIDDEIVINQGMLKKITSSYFEKGQNKSLKSLTFEFTRKVPYKIWQEDNKILLDIRAPLKISGLPEENNEVLVRSETGTVIIKKLEAMEKALTQVAESQPKEGIAKTESGILLPESNIPPVAKPLKAGTTITGVVFWLIGLPLVFGIGFLIWLFWHRYRLILDKNVAMQEIIKLRQEITKLKSELQEKNKLLEQEEIIRKSVEATSLAREKEFGQLKLELQEKSRLFEQEAAIRSEKEKVLSEKEKEYEHLKETSESLKGVLVKRGIARELTLPEEKGELWILGKSPEKRNSPRLALSKDFHNTVILKIELPGSLKQIKSFAENISSEGLCFETKNELDERNPFNLRLFFYGGKVPNFKTQGWIVWKKPQDSKNYYGITFEGLSEKVKSELQHYIESNIPTGVAIDKL